MILHSLISNSIVQLVSLLGKWTEIVEGVSKNGFEEVLEAIQSLKAKVNAGAMVNFPQRLSALLRELLDSALAWETAPCQEIICFR